MRAMRGAIKAAAWLVLALAIPVYAQNWIVQNGANSVVTNTTTTGVTVQQKGTGNALGVKNAAGSEVWSVSNQGVMSNALGTLSTDAQAISTSATWNNAATAFTHWKAVITDTASAAGSLAVNILGGTAGTTTLFSLTKAGLATFGSDVLVGNGQTAPLIQFGGTSSSFPAIKRSATTLQVKLADDSASATLNANLSFAGNTLIANSLLASVTAPSSPTSCGNSPAVTTSNGSAAWVITGGTGGAATGCTVTMPGATNGWNCVVTNITQTAAHRADRTTVQTASTTTSVTWEYQTVSTGAATIFTASDVFRGICIGY